MVDMSKEHMLLSEREAQQIVGNPEIAATFERIRDGYIAGWKKTTPQEVEKRELAYACYKAVSDVWGELQRKAMSAATRDKLDQASKAHCPKCGVAEGSYHRDDCPIFLERQAQVRAVNNG